MGKGRRYREVRGGREWGVIRVGLGLRAIEKVSL
jgi:hypothetical protein